MCGIAGVLYADADHPVSATLLHRMAASIAHRGPDGSAVWVGRGIGLAHRRLAIIDLETGTQPMTNEDGTLQAVFNGEIYNYRQLRADLETRGHIFRTQSDTEVLLHLYEERKDALAESLRGMFAFALWDGRERTLLLARDRVGIKPLYLFRDEHRVVFGSELKALLVEPTVPRDIDPQAVGDYLTFGMVQGERSIFRQVRRLAPATTLRIGQDGLNAVSRRYWVLRFAESAHRSESEAGEAVRAKLAETVRAHLISDVPVGAFLSGGIDSSVVVGLAASSSNDQLSTFSIGFEEEAYSELPYARAVAQQFNTRHSEAIVTADSMALVDELVRFYDEPFADSSAIPTYLVSRLAARSVKVVLSGDGGDEAFGGYLRYAHDLREHHIRRRLPHAAKSTIAAPLAKIWPKADWLPRPLRAKTFFTNLSLPSGFAYANSLAICREPQRGSLMNPRLRGAVAGHDPGSLVALAYERIGDHDPLAAMIAADVEIRLPDDYLVKVDRASMAHGLEVRPPFLDHELLELTATIPSHLKVRRGQTKYLLKSAFRDFLPAAVLRHPKQGFSVPLDDWFRGPLRSMFEDVALQRSGVITDLIEQRAVKRVFAAHVSGTGRHGAILWAVLTLARWCDEYISPTPIAAVT